MRLPQLLKMAFCALLMVNVAACASNPTLETLRQTPPKGTAFQNELAKLYLTYAETSQQASDYQSATLFAEKGLNAAYGNDVSPEDPKDWDLGEARAQYDDMQLAINELLSEELKTAAPLAAAGAVFFYDCMIDQEQAGEKTAEMNYCQSQWESAMGDLRSEQARLVSEQSLVEQAPMPMAKFERYLVYFALDDYSLNSAASRTIKLLYDELAKYQAEQQKISLTIVVNGHADTSGSDRHNMILSNDRADSVKQKLIELGMAAGQIATYGYGETDLAVPTPDNTFEPKNRRVEIVVN